MVSGIGTQGPSASCKDQRPASHRVKDNFAGGYPRLLLGSAISEKTLSFPALYLSILFFASIKTDVKCHSPRRYSYEAVRGIVLPSPREYAGFGARVSRALVNALQRRCKTGDAGSSR